MQLFTESSICMTAISRHSTSQAQVPQAWWRQQEQAHSQRKSCRIMDSFIDIHITPPQRTQGARAAPRGWSQLLSLITPSIDSRKALIWPKDWTSPKPRCTQGRLQAGCHGEGLPWRRRRFDAVHRVCVPTLIRVRGRVATVGCAAARCRCHGDSWRKCVCVLETKIEH